MDGCWIAVGLIVSRRMDGYRTAAAVPRTDSGDECVHAAASKRVYSWRAVIWMNSWLEDRASRSSSPGVQSLFDALSRSLLPVGGGGLCTRADRMLVRCMAAGRLTGSTIHQ